MTSFTIFIVCLIGAWYLKNALIKNGKDTMLFVFDMVVDLLLLIVLNFVGLVIVIFFEYKHVKRALNNNNIKDFVYGRYQTGGGQNDG